MNKLSDSIKSVAAVALVLLTGTLSAMKLMEIQVVGGSESVAQSTENNASALVYTKDIRSTRGEILDFHGNKIVGNTLTTNIVLQKSTFPEDFDEGNEVLLGIYEALQKNGCTVKQCLPITQDQPYVFTTSDQDKIQELIADLNLNVYATAENCIDKIIDDYDIDDSYTDEEKRIIAGFRYEMQAMDFSFSNDLILAENVPAEAVIDLKERSNTLKGLNAVSAAEREILRGDILPHEIGTVGPMWAEEYEQLKDKGYALNDELGKNGIEYAMETELRGVFGKEKVTVENGRIKSSEVVDEAQAGYTVKLTVDGAYQLKLQGILDNFIANFQKINSNPVLKDVNCGAIVVLDAKTGAVRGMATAPTYNLLDYTEHYDEISKAKNSPLVNRATYGQYRPGSTFKTITATAGLNEGIVNPTSTFYCGQKYEYIDTKLQCTGCHHDIAVTKAIEVSCNIYFYELSQRLTIDRITEYAKLYGLGQHTGIETGDAEGYLCNPETFAARGLDWYVGYVLQAGIGNQDCGITPLQMAVVANTIANDGVRYKPYLVDSLCDYGTGEVVSKTEPTVVQEITPNYDYVYDSIEQGMIGASRNVPAGYSLSNLGFDVAIKTGTPQTGEHGEQNSFFIGYAPADDPELAFAGVIEGGEYSKYMIRDIILAYKECYGIQGSKPTASLESVAASTTATSGTGTAASSTVTTTTTTAAP